VSQKNSPEKKLHPAPISAWKKLQNRGWSRLQDLFETFWIRPIRILLLFPFRNEGRKMGFFSGEFGFGHGLFFVQKANVASGIQYLLFR